MKFNSKNFLSYLKPVLIVSLILVVLSAVIFGVFGFNKGFDFTGGTQLVVDVSSYNENEPEGLTQEENKIAQEISNILKSNGVKINSLQVQGEYTYKSLVITFKDVGTEKLNSIRMEINNKYNKSTSFSELNDAYDITRNTTHIDGLLTSNIVLTTISTLLFALIICMIYALFRVKVTGALSIVLSGVMSVVLTACFVVLTRIEINTYFFVALAVVEFFSVFLTVDTLFKIKDKLKDPIYSDKNNHEIAQVVLKENLTKNVIVAVSSLVLTLIIGLVSVLNILKLSLVVIVGIIVGFVVNMFVVPVFWANVTKNRELVTPKKVGKNVYIEKEINNQDKDAKVIEVNE